MDLRQLRTFVTVAEQGTVSRASAELRVAQPALSRQIQDLENELGIKLFDRIRRRLLLTTEGKLLLSDCRSTLNAVSSIREKAQMLRQSDAGVLSVAATPQTIDGVLSVFLAQYARERPNVHVTLIEAVGAELMALLHRGEAHLLITTAGAIEGSDQPVDTIWLPSLEFIAASTPDVRLGHSSWMDIRGLGSHPLLLPNKSFAVRQAFDAACRIAEFKPNIRFESRTPHTLLALAESGLGVAVVPSVLPTHRYKLEVVGLTYRDKPLREAYGLVWARQRARPPVADEFAHALASFVREAFPISRPSAPRSKRSRQAASRASKK
jgi:LysR family nitrogen assimilation transcriptional regulator